MTFLLSTKQNALIFACGNLVDENYITKDNDIIEIRVFPAWGWHSVKKFFKKAGSTLKKALSVTNPIKLITHPVNFFKDLYDYTMGGIKYWGKKLLGVEDPKAIKNNTDEEQQLPSINGARNQSQDGQCFPLVLGKSLYTPMYIGSPYTSTNDNDGCVQWYYALFLLGYNDIKVTNIKMDELDIASNKEGVTSGYITIDGSSKFKDCQIEIRDDGINERQQPFCHLYMAKEVQEQLGFELLNTEGKGCNCKAI